MSKKRFFTPSAVSKIHSLYCGYRKRLRTWLFSLHLVTHRATALNEHSMLPRATEWTLNAPVCHTHCGHTSKLPLKHLFQIFWQKWEVWPYCWILNPCGKHHANTLFCVWVNFMGNICCKCPKQKIQDSEIVQHRRLTGASSWLNANVKHLNQNMSKYY